MTIGSDWKKALETKKASAAQDDRARTDAAGQAEADAAIASIPGLIRMAKASGTDSVQVLQRILTFEDVACKDVDDLTDALARRPLVESDLAGAALLVFRWCEANDLVCSIVSVGKFMLAGHQYHLVAKPK